MKKIIFLLAMLTIACSVQAQTQDSTETVITLEKQWYVTVGDVQYIVNLSSQPFNSIELPADLDETIPWNVAEAIWTADSLNFPVNKLITFNVVDVSQKTYNLVFQRFMYCGNCDSDHKETEYFAYVQRVGKVMAQNE